MLEKVMIMLGPLTITREDLRQAIRDIDSTIEITLDDLVDIIQRAINHASLRRAQELPIAKLMVEDVIAIGPDASLLEAGGRFIEYKIGILPVVDSDNRLLGILTEADVLTAAGLPHHHCGSRLRDLWETVMGHHSNRAPMEAPVSQVMSTKVVTVMETDTLRIACERMKKANIKSLVVIDGQNSVKGIVSRSTVIKALVKTSGSGNLSCS